MNCGEVRDLIVETLSGTTPPDLRRAVEAHLATCPACRAEAADAEETVTLLRSVPDPHLRDEHWAGLMAQLAERLAREKQRPWARVRRWFHNPRHAWSTAAATAALVIALGAAWLVPGAPVGSHPPDPASVQVMEFLSPQVVEGMPAMNASLVVWKAGLGAGDVSYELSGGR